MTNTRKGFKLTPTNKDKRIEELEKENRLLGERCNQLLKDKGDLTDQIADIKANCDLAIEGRDVKIKELELELTVEKDQHQEEVNLHLHAEDYIKSLEKEISVLLSCKNCPENKGGLICAKEYENKCLAQKIQHIKELQEENEELKKELTKATEIIKKFSEFVNNEIEYDPEHPQVHTDLWNNLCEQAEQFLKGENIILEDAQAGNSPFDADKVFNKEMKAYPKK